MTSHPKAAKKAGASAHWASSSAGIGGPLGVVAAVELHPILRRLGAEADHHGPRGVGLDGGEDEVGRAEQGVDGLAVGARDGLGEGEEGAVKQRRGVDREQRTAPQRAQGRDRAPVRGASPTVGAAETFGHDALQAEPP
jgi:hypothetical protein